MLCAYDFEFKGSFLGSLQGLKAGVHGLQVVVSEAGASNPAPSQMHDAGSEI
jgi:hypothetical protein